MTHSTLSTNRNDIGTRKYVHAVYDANSGYLLGHKGCPMVILDPCVEGNIQVVIEPAESRTSVLSAVQLKTSLYTKLELGFLDSDAFYTE